MTAFAWLLAWSGGFCAGVLAERIKRLSKSCRRDPARRLVRFDEGRIQRSHSGAGYQPKPQITPHGQRRTPNPPPSKP